MMLFMSMSLAPETYESSLLAYIALAAHSQLLFMKMHYQWPRACMGTPTILNLFHLQKTAFQGLLRILKVMAYVHRVIVIQLFALHSQLFTKAYPIC